MKALSGFPINYTTFAITKWPWYFYLRFMLTQMCKKSNGEGIQIKLNAFLSLRRK